MGKAGREGVGRAGMGGKGEGKRVEREYVVFASVKINSCVRPCKSSVGEVSSLCDCYDMIFIQERWLLPSELGFLSSIYKDFLALGLSAVDISSDILIGRPYGRRTAILCRRSLSTSIVPVDTSDSRLTTIIYQASIGPVLLLCVYMPTDYGNSVSLENYIETCANITALYNDVWATKILLNVGEHTSKSCITVIMTVSLRIPCQLIDSLASATHSGFTVQHILKIYKSRKVEKVLV